MAPRPEQALTAVLSCPATPLPERKIHFAPLNAAGERLLPAEIFNSDLVLMVVTSLLGPVLTELFTPAMLNREKAAKAPGAMRQIPEGPLPVQAPPMVPESNGLALPAEKIR